VGNRSLYQAYRRLESFAARNSDGMSTLSHAVIPVLESRNRKLPSLRIVVPTTVDLNKFLFEPNMPVIPQALFSGTYNDYYDLKLSARFMNEVRKLTHLETHWARPMESVKSQINVGESKVIQCLQTDMPQLIPNYSFGVSICNLSAGPSLTAAMPTKIGEFLASGRPVIVSNGIGDLDHMLTSTRTGVVINHSDSLQNIASQIRTLISDPKTPERCRELAMQHFDMEKSVDRYLEIYDRMQH
jgi:hypothetical protein